MTDRDLMKQALDALEIAEVDGNCCYEATELLRTRLTQPAPQPKQKPVAWLNKEKSAIFWSKLYPDMQPLYTTPPQRTEQEPVDLEIMASAVHDAYLNTCNALGWGVKLENRVPYSELTENSKELDRASVRAVLRLVVPQPQRKPLSQYAIDRIIGRLQVKFPDWLDTDVMTQFARAIEAAHGIKEKNNG